MASGDTIFVLEPLGSTPPGTLYATIDFIADASSPASNIPVLDFDTSTSEHAEWHVTVPSNYDGGGFTISWKGGTSAANAGTLEIEVRAIVIADATTLTGDLGIDTQTEATITDTPTATANQMNQSTTATLAHADAGSPSAGDRMIIRATRDTATDTNTGDLQLQEILILET
jgi:hypothetical protein